MSTARYAIELFEGSGWFFERWSHPHEEDFVRWTQNNAYKLDEFQVDLTNPNSVASELSKKFNIHIVTLTPAGMPSVIPPTVQERNTSVLKELSDLQLKYVERCDEVDALKKCYNELNRTLQSIHSRILDKDELIRKQNKLIESIFSTHDDLRKDWNKTHE